MAARGPKRSYGRRLFLIGFRRGTFKFPISFVLINSDFTTIRSALSLSKSSQETARSTVPSFISAKNVDLKTVFNPTWPSF